MENETNIQQTEQEKSKGNKIWAFFKNNWKDILLFIFLFAIIILIMSTTCARQRADIAENNLKAATDTLHTYKLKNGALMYEKQGYILKIDELEDAIGITKKEAKELERKLGSALATISKLQGQVRVDTIHMIDSIYITSDSTYHNHFNYSDKWIALDGESTFKLEPFKTQTTINSISMDVPLKVGTTEDNKWFAVSDNPYVSFTSVEGANIEKAKPKRHSIGVQIGLGGMVGYGVCIPPSGGTVNSGIMIGGGLYFGIGYTYKLIDF